VPYVFYSLKSAAILRNAAFHVISACKCNENMNLFISRLEKDTVRMKTQEGVLFENKESTVEPGYNVVKGTKYFVSL
jgi:hypothetical protein